jgi:beta-lactam-binding protein with PASTA domain
MASRRELPADVAAAFERVPEAGDRFASLPAARQAEWLTWIDRGRGRRGRAARIDEMVRRLLPSATTAEEEVAEPVGPPPERYWWLWLLLLLLLVVGGLLAWYFLSRGDDKTTVPNVIGLRERVATERIRDRDLDPVPRVGASNRPQGVVFAQKPGAGTQMDEGQTVTISISSGRHSVPDVTGLPLKDAQQQLQEAGFKTEVNRVASSRPKGVVIDQAPIAGVTAVTGTTVKLSVSSGVKPVIVPSVVGLTQGAAVQTLTRLGLKPQLQNVPSDRPAGIVVAQKPPANKEVDKGSKVTLNISTGTGGGTTTVSTTTTTPGTTTTATTTVTTTTAAAPVRVPRIVGLAQTSALRRLNVRGLRPTVVYVRSTQPANRVISQRPAAGTTLRRGSRVRVNVSTGPNPQPATAVPNVIGQDQATAASTLRSAGFRVVVLNRPTANQSQDGLVVDEQPRAGSNIPAGSQVTIFVGRFSG